MSRARSAYAEGNGIAVPLEGGGYALGVIARANMKGGMFVYFFAPKVESVPLEWTVPPASEAIWITKVGDLGLLNGTWKLIPRLRGPDATKWPLPGLVQVEPISNRVWLEDYDDIFANPVRRVQISPEEARQFPEAGAAGTQFAVTRLTRLLGGRA